MGSLLDLEGQNVVQTFEVGMDQERRSDLRGRDGQRTGSEHGART
jgi:hypothetical protein